MRLRDLGGVALVAVLSLDATVEDARAQQRPASSDRRLVFPAGQISGLSGSYWTAALANGGPSPPHERLLAVTPDGRVLSVIDGERDRVRLSIDLVRELSERKLQATLVHNHPTSVGLGESDLTHLAKVGVSRVVAIASEGTVYEAAAGARYDVAEGLYPVLESRVRERLAAEARRNREDPQGLSAHVPHLIAAVLQRARVIEYLVTPSESIKLAFDRYHGLFERVVMVEARRLEDDLQPEGRPGRPDR
jgi:hypothetical protein